MKTVSIIAGVDGVGKTSLLGILKAERNDLGLVIDIDMQKAQLYIQRGISFTQETTLSGSRTEKTIRRAKEQGYKIRLYYIGLNSSQESVERIGNRVRKGGHDIPTEDVQRRYTSRFTDLLKVLSYCDEAVFFDNDNGFVEVAEYRNGELVIKGSYRPAWIEELSKAMEE